MGKYDDLLSLPHHQSETRARMPMADRAAQFAPFAALTGYEDAIAETARLTEPRPELDEQAREQLNFVLLELAARCAERPEAEFVRFREDVRKEGGCWETVRGRVKCIDPQTKSILLESGERIDVRDLRAVECL